MLFSPSLTFRSNLANWNALFLLNHVWQLGGETGLLNHLLGFQWDWLILLMSLKHCKHCCAAVAISDQGREDQSNRVCTQANLQILVDSEMIRPGSEWKMPRCTQLVSGQCTVVGWMSQEPNYLVNEIILMIMWAPCFWNVSNILTKPNTVIIKKQGKFQTLHWHCLGASKLNTSKLFAK